MASNWGDGCWAVIGTETQIDIHTSTYVGICFIHARTQNFEPPKSASLAAFSGWRPSPFFSRSSRNFSCTSSALELLPGAGWGAGPRTQGERKDGPRTMAPSHRSEMRDKLLPTEVDDANAVWPCAKTNDGTMCIAPGRTPSPSWPSQQPLGTHRRSIPDESYGRQKLSKYTPIF